MSRLKDALDRAARKSSEQSRQAFTPPTQVVPEAWPFQEGDELTARIVGETPLHGDALAQAASAAEAMSTTEQFAPERHEAVVGAPPTAPSAADAAESASVRRARAEFWARYPFGAKGIGKVIVLIALREARKGADDFAAAIKRAVEAEPKRDSPL